MYFLLFPQQGPPDKPSITGSLSATEGEAFQLQCQARHAYPASTLRWYLNSRDITSSAQDENSPDGDGRFDTTSTLTYTPTKEDHLKYIRCDAHHQASSPVRSNDIRLTVNCM